MKVTTSQRLKQLMSDRGLKQVDILEQSKAYQKELDIKMSKSSLSEYVSGASNPDQNKLLLLGRTLNVSEAWLMGYDVPMERITNNITTETNQGLVMGSGDNNGDVTINNAKDEHDSCRQQEMADNSAEDIDLQKEILVHIDAQTEIQQKILDTQKKILKEVKRLNMSSEAQNEPLTDFNEVHEELYPYNVYERLSAGAGSAVWDDGSFDTAYFDKELPHDIASWVYGDSMEPTFLDGEVALIRANGYDYDGAVYAVVWDGRTYIKRVYKEEDGLRLESLNPKYRDLFAPFEEEPRVIGLVVGHFMPMER